jgi:hypothetical protein
VMKSHRTKASRKRRVSEVVQVLLCVCVIATSGCCSPSYIIHDDRVVQLCHYYFSATFLVPVPIELLPCPSSITVCDTLLIVSFCP